MKMDKFIENLLIELSYRSNEGYPQLNNPTHQTIITEILADWDLSELSYPLIKNLLEAEGEDNDEPQSDYEHLGAGVYVRRGDKDKEGAQKYTKTDTGTFQSISDDEYEKIKNKQGDSGEKAAADTPQNQTQGGGDGDEGGEEDKPGKSLDPNTPEGKAYIGTLPKTDPARKLASTDNKDDNDETPKKIIPGEPNQKDKSLDPDVNTSSTEVFTSPTTGINDEQYTEQKEVTLINPDVDYTNDITNIIEGSGVPLKYAKVLSRLLNTKNRNSVSITNLMTGVGAGQIASQGGEILTMMSIGLSDEQADKLFSMVDEVVASQSKKDYPIITKDWVESAKYVRAITKKRYDYEFGEGDWKIKNSAWDTKAEFEALGNSDYEKNKGFSSDMYVKLEVDGKPVLDEISLKKDSEANLFNGSVTEIKKWFGGDVPPKADFKVYKKGELQRPTEYGEGVTSDEYESVFVKSDEDIKNSLVNSNGRVKQTLKNTGVISVNRATGNWEVTSKGEEYIKKLRELKVPPPIDKDRFKETFGSGASDRFKKGMIVHAAILASEGNETAYSFLNNHLGYEAVDGRFPEGSIKRYQNDTIRALVDSDEAKTNLLNALQEKLPMKSLIEGEEKMAIGGLSVDNTTLKNLLDIETFEDFKGGLTMVNDGEDNNFLIYKSEGPPANEVQLAEVKVRQKGQGYASSVGLEFAIASDFSKKMYEANKEVYGDVQISNKEKRRLKI